MEYTSTIKHAHIYSNTNLNMCEAEIMGLYQEKDTFAALYK